MRASTWRPFPPEYGTCEKAHGRIEERRIWTSTALHDYVRFPYVRQVACVERRVQPATGGSVRVEYAYLLTSLDPAHADAKRLLTLNRGHWRIENGLHYVRDMAYDEDRCRARRQHAPRTLACLRNFAISLLRVLGMTGIKAALRTFAATPRLALAVLRL